MSRTKSDHFLMNMGNASETRWLKSCGWSGDNRTSPAGTGAGRAGGVASSRWIAANCLRVKAQTIQEFPLIWRWTSRSHPVFPAAVLSQLQPLGLPEAQLAHERLLRFQRGAGLKHSAEVSEEEGLIWLRERHTGLSDIVTVSWDPKCALRTSWVIFTEYWGDFCYPSSDDVTIWPDSEQWALHFHHWEEFEFVRNPVRRPPQ